VTLGGCGLIGHGQATALPTVTSFPFVTATERPTATPTVPTATPTATATIFIPTHTYTPRPTLTPSPTAGASHTPAGTPTATIPGAGGCQVAPKGVFLEVYLSDPGLPTILGCPTAPPNSKDPPDIWEVQAIYQPFERGHMLWLSNVGWFDAQVIYVMLDDQSYTRYDDDYDPNTDPESGNFRPPEGLYEPVEALGKLWRNEPGLKDRIGFATAPQMEMDTSMQMFTYGEMVHLSAIEGVFVFKRGLSNTWLFYSLQPEPEG
jgi:hypothetical protein